jgi:SWI/SNF related-matrix-associated actin-dependent regulator of chromatin subfamily C
MLGKKIWARLNIIEFRFRLVFNCLLDNPVLSLTSFLATLVSPKVAQAAAQAAVDKLDQMSGIVGKAGAPNSPTKSPTKGSPLEKAASAAFGSAAAKAHVITLNEELEMQKATRILIEVQLKKMELKLAHFQEMEACLEHERKEIERERQALYLERLALKEGKSNGVRSKKVNEVDFNGDVDMTGNFLNL